MNQPEVLRKDAKYALPCNKAYNTSSEEKAAKTAKNPFKNFPTHVAFGWRNGIFAILRNEPLDLSSLKPSRGGNSKTG